MTFKSSLMFARSLIFPKTEKSSSARRSLFGAMLCIGLSIVPLIVVISVTDGMIDGMTERIIGLSSNHLQVYISPKLSSVNNINTFEEYATSLTKINGVKKVYPEINLFGLAVGKNERCGIEIRGVNQNIFEENNSFKKLFTVIDGNINDFNDSQNIRQIVIGKKLSEDLQLKVGDSLKIITTKTTAGKITPKLTSYKITAIISSGYQELDQFWVFLPIQSCYKNLALDSASYNIMIETPDAFGSQLVRIQRDLRKTVGRYANVYRWDEIHTAEFENFSSTKVMLVFVMFLIVLVSCVNISSAIIMLVIERQKEIAILKSIGATPRGITISFLLAALACSTGGLIIGIPIGILFTIFSNELVKGIEIILNCLTSLVNGAKINLMDKAYYLEEIPVEIPWLKILLIIIAVWVLSLLVSYLPSRKAGKEKPLDILRKV